MRYIPNPHRGAAPLPLGAPTPSINAAAVAALLAECPAHEPTALRDSADIAERAGVASVHVKDERTRMGLGSFKALGAAYVIATEAAAVGGDLTKALAGRTYITASAGNHGMSVAAGARVFGANAVIHIAETVPEVFGERLESLGATVVRGGADYEESMVAAMASAEANGWELLSDTSWPQYTDRPHRLMEGYLQMAAEAADEIPEPPTHIFLQAGVGGLACAVAALCRDRWGGEPKIIVVEPEEAPALHASAMAGKVLNTPGGVSDMGRLDCKEPSLIALAGLTRDADFFSLISEQEAFDTMPVLKDAGLETSTSGGAGLACLLNAKGEFGLDGSSRVLCFLSEGPA